MDTENLVEALKTEKSRIDQLGINEIVFNIYQRLYANDARVGELIARHMYDFIGRLSSHSRIYHLSTLYVILKECNCDEDVSAGLYKDLITYLNSNDLFENFGLKFAEDILDKMAENRVAFYSFDETTNYEHCEHEVTYIVDLLHSFLGTIVFSYRDVHLNNYSKEMAQSNIDNEYKNISACAKRLNCESILPKLDDIRKHALE